MRRTLAIAVAFAVVAVSCGDDTAEYPTVSPEGASQMLDEFLGWTDFDRAAADQAYVDLSGRMGAMTAECMADHGLEYTVWTPPEFEGPNDLPENEFLRLYGYGFFAWLLEQYRYEMEHAAELENPNEAIHAQNAPEGVDYMSVMWECENTTRAALMGPNPELPRVVDEAWSPLNLEVDRMREDLERDPAWRRQRRTGLRAWPSGVTTSPPRTTSPTI